MSNLVPFSDQASVPDHIARQFGGSLANNDLSNGVGGGGFPVVSYKGKVWHVVKGDERTLVTNAEGEPRSSLDVVILKANPNLSKIYYKAGYEEGSSAKPDCFSLDGLVPSVNAQDKQSDKCASCKWNAWGSRISENGAKGKACADSRRLAVAPAYDLENPMLLRVPAGTLKELTAYAQMLNRRKAPYSAVITRIGFDHTVAYPKMQFKATRWLTEEEGDTVAGVLEDDILGDITGTGEEQQWNNDAADTLPPKPEAKPARAAKPKPHEVTQEEVEVAVAPAQVDEEEPEMAAPKPKAPSKVAKVLESADASLDDILASLDD